jgi:quercetin dioxygenase-like cupin family protein
MKEEGVKKMTKARQRVSQEKEGRTGHESLAGRLAAPLMDFNLSNEIAQLHQEDAWLRTGHTSKTLVKQPDFRIVLIALKKGGRLEEHKADGRISIQTLSGHVRLRILGQSVDLPAGQLLALDRGLQHDVEAIEESSFLLTISWRKSVEKD